MLVRSLLLASVVLAVFGLWKHFAAQRDNEQKATPEIHVVPQPQDVTVYPGTCRVSSAFAVYWSGDIAQPAAAQWAELWQGYTGVLPEIRKMDHGQESTPCIALSVAPDLATEAYRLLIEEEVIEVQAATEAGFFYASQTLRQLLDAAKVEQMRIVREQRIDEPGQVPPLRLPTCSIRDAPAFAWRGVLLDASRHFWTPEQVMRVIDQLAYHKMNVLHWHLTDDQGWRLALASRPELAEHAAWRTEPDGSTYGGFYNPEEVDRIVAYAAERQVTVVPEIEMPGHCQAALAAYPELSCTGGPFAVWNDWGVSKEIYCAGNEAVFVFLDEVLDAVMVHFPSTYIHLGGDEAPKARWEACSKCRHRMAGLDLHDAHDLQSWFLRRVADSLALHGRRMIGWDEILDGGQNQLHPDAVVQAWRGMDRAEAALAAGHPVIVSPTSHAYFDYGLNSIDLDVVLGFDPVPPSAKNTPQAALVLGGAANCWSERIPDQATLDERLFPRLLAMAQVLWRGPGAMDNSAFRSYIRPHYALLDQMGIAYGAERVPLQVNTTTDPGGWVDVRFVPGSEDLTIHWVEHCVEGPFGVLSEPDTNDLVFDPDPATGAHLSLLDGDHTLSARAFRDGKPYGAAVQRSYRLHRATGRQPVLAAPWNPSYPAGGAGALSDGCLGTTDFRDGLWQGYFGSDLDALFDLGAIQPVDTVLLGAFQYINSWIFLPTRVRVYTGESVEKLKLAATVENPVSEKERSVLNRTFVAAFPEQQARFVRVVAENKGFCPSWHEAAGSPAWLFVDEIAVR